jgi:hypothetical protein
MAKQTILVGAYPNDGNGDPLRDAMVKVNDNFTELYDNYQTEEGLSANVAKMTANNVSYVGTVSAANVISNNQLSSNLALYQTLADMPAAVVVLTSNSSNYIGSLPAANVVSNSQLSSNLVNYQTTAGLSANVVKLTSNNSNYLGGVAAASYATQTYVTTQGYITGIADSGNVAYDSTRLGGTSASGYQTTAGLSSNVATLNANNASYLGTVAAANYVQNTQSRTLSGNLTFSGANIVISANLLTLGIPSITANGYTYLPNGLLMQWGSLQVNSSTTAQSFPVSYTTNAYSITATGNTVAANGTYVPVVFSVTKTGFTIRTGNTANVLCYWTSFGV